MRSQGQVRFIRISSRIQMFGAAVVVALTGAWLLTMAIMLASQYLATRDRLSLLDREAEVAKSESRVSAYRKDISGVAADLAKRQKFLEDTTEAHLGQLPADMMAGETVSNSAGEAEQTVHKVSASIPEARSLAELEARQLAFAERLTRLADRRAAQAAVALRKLGLNPAAMLAALDDKSAQGGPLLKDGSLDPRFQRLGLSLARMEAMEQGLKGVPQFHPASLEFISSGFGYRSDPFTGEAALHAGLDFKGPIGAPIYSAAQGVVSFAGVKQGYGNCIEVTHGNGMMTRYAHMSAYRAVVGQKVAAGQVIGLIGNSGRSTGPHLHFEVRINDRAVNPRTFLETAPHVLEEARTHRGSASGAARR